MEWLLLLPIALAAAGLYALFKPPASSERPNLPAEPDGLQVPALEAEGEQAVATVHAVPAPVTTSAEG